MQLAKRALVSLLKALAVQYQVLLTLNRESSDTDVSKAFKKIALKAHPDKGGREEDFKKLNAAREFWDDCKSGETAFQVLASTVTEADALEEAATAAADRKRGQSSQRCCL